jgi:membrane protease YdiL (CAAX protease family)
MAIKEYKHPLLFYLLCTIVPWTFWFTSAYYSRDPSYSLLSGSLALVGLISPVIIAFSMMYINPTLRQDLWSRLFTVQKTQPIYLFLTLAVMPCSILLAQAISLILGYSVNQFSFSSGPSFSYALFSPWVMLFLAPILEELAWHSYGTDCLRVHFNLFVTSLIFAVFWALWHLPLAFVKDYYHSNVAHMSWIYSANFLLSIIPFVILMNWLYYKTHRNIMVAVVFHTTANVFNEIFSTHPDSKVIQTILLLGFAIIVLFAEPKFFFRKRVAGVNVSLD